MLYHGSKIGKNKNFLKVEKVGAEDKILTVQEKQVAHIDNNTKIISLEITPQQREAEARLLKEYKQQREKFEK